MARVLLVVPDLGLVPGPGYAPGGLQKMGRMVARALADMPQVEHLSVWSLKDSDACMQEVLPQVLQPSALHPAGASMRGFSSGRVRMSMHFLRRGRSFDHAMFLHVGVGAMACALPAGSYSLWLVGKECTQRLPWLQARAVRRARPLLSISRYTADEMRRHNPWASGAEVVHLGMEPEAAWLAGGAPEGTPAVAGCPAGQRAPIVLTVGRLSRDDRYKGYDKLIAAWPAVVAQHPAARLRIVGDGDDRTDLQRAAHALPEPARSQVDFLGRVAHAQLQALYREARVFALPSTQEGFGLVHLEAMEAGTPCICSRDAAQEVVEHEVTGLVVDQDAAAVASAVTRLLGDPALCDRMGAAGKSRLEQRFTYEAFRARLAASLAGVFGAAGSTR